MLERMYLRWAAARGYRVATTSRTPGEPQGLEDRFRGCFTDGVLVTVPPLVHF